MFQRPKVTQSSSNETIHSGHFMISNFEADAQEDEYEVAVPVPEMISKKLEIIPLRNVRLKNVGDRHLNPESKMMSVSIETSLTKLFQCMSIAYRQKLTSPKWNRFKGVRLRWKEKIRLNNVIWRCWHMQFVLKRNTGICQFASPLDVDIHSKPEAVVLEGKYWKRKLNAVTAEYKRWRIFYQRFSSGVSTREQSDQLAYIADWDMGNTSNDSMMVDEDYANLLSDTLFSSTNACQSFEVPNTKEVARGASLADFIQPSLVQLQPNLDEYIDMLEPLQEFLSSSSKLPSVPEEYHPSDDLYRSLNVNYEDISASSFYSQTTSSGLDATHNTGDQKTYVKLEQDQPMQLRAAAQNVAQKTEYQSASLYTGTSSSSTSSILSSHNNSIYSDSYPSQNFHQPSTSDHSDQDNVLNYSHQINKNVAALSQTPISYNSSSTTGSRYTSYDSMTNRYNAGNTSAAPTAPSNQGYLPSSSSNYKILPTARSARSSSLSMSPDDELFATPKLSQKGRSRSGSSLITTHASTYAQNEQCISETSRNSGLLTQLLTNTRHFGCSRTGHPSSSCSNSNVNHYHTNSGCDIRTCYSMNGHREVAHCAALLGRRSRTPDHILSSYSNPVGYCKPRSPALSAQGSHDGSLINLSCSQREASSYNKTYMNVPESANSVHAHSFGYSSRYSQCLPKSPYEKYTTSPLIPGQGWTILGPSSSSSTSASSVPPFIFNGNQIQTDTSNLPQIMNSASTSSSPKHQSSPSPSTSESLSLSPLTVSSPVRMTPSSPTTKSSNSNTPYKEHRRVCHINAEQKRRCNIKNGFDTLHQLIPHLAQNPNTKMSKAAMLQKGAEYIKTLRDERSQIKEEIESLKRQVELLNSSISNCQSMLPATGAPVSRHKADKMKEMYDEYVRERTKQNWKFWILSLIGEPLLSSFNSTVSNSSVEELYRTTLQWAEQYCSLVDLRPIVLNALRHVCITTDILSNPDQLPEEAQAFVSNPYHHQKNSNSNNNNNNN